MASIRDTQTILLHDLKVLTVADGKDLILIPADMYISRVHMYVSNTGNAGLNIDATVFYTPPLTSLARVPPLSWDLAGDLWLAGAGVGRLPGGGAQNFLDWTDASLAIRLIQMDGVLSLNVDVVPGGAPADLVIQIFGYPVND